ncbi:hypothetical protein STEG23_027298, partial [Scotinomys teguina]
MNWGSVEVEANPRKFNLDPTELSIRKAFITSTRQIVRHKKSQLLVETGESRFGHSGFNKDKDFVTTSLGSTVRDLCSHKDFVSRLASLFPCCLALDSSSSFPCPAFLAIIKSDMKDQMSASSVQALTERKNRQALLGDSSSQNWNSGVTDRYRRLDQELQLANSHFIEEQQAQQQLIVEQQDEQLELVSGSIGVLKNMSQRIGGELEEQAV